MIQPINPWFGVTTDQDARAPWCRPAAAPAVEWATRFLAVARRRQRFRRSPPWTRVFSPRRWTSSARCSSASTKTSVPRPPAASFNEPPSLSPILLTPSPFARAMKKAPAKHGTPRVCGLLTTTPSDGPSLPDAAGLFDRRVRANQGAARARAGDVRGGVRPRPQRRARGHRRPARRGPERQR